MITRSSDNAVVWKWENSDPFGANAPNEDPANTGTAFKYNLRFPGQVEDGETNTHYNYFRDYQASTGRYLQSDPIGLAGGMNRYGYVGGGPVGRIDPFGLAASCTADSAGNKTITIPITYSGPGATSAVTDAMSRAIETTWSAPGYTVVVTTGADNTVNVPTGRGTSFVNAVGGNRGTWYADEIPWVAAHEAGHLMGLPDRYRRVPGSVPETSVIEPGYESNIMGIHRGTVSAADRLAAASWSGCR